MIFLQKISKKLAISISYAVILLLLRHQRKNIL